MFDIPQLPSPGDALPTSGLERVVKHFLEPEMHAILSPFRVRQLSRDVLHPYALPGVRRRRREYLYHRPHELTFAPGRQPGLALRARQVTDWFEYERGRISQQECYARVGEEFTVAPSDVDEALKQARESLRPNEELLALVRELKGRDAGRLRVFALSNISLPDYEYVSTLPTDWSIFDRVFPSALLGERKPDLAAYEKVVREADIDPTTAVFVDDKLENVEAARQLGIHGIVFDKQEGVFQALRKIFGDSVQEKESEGH